MNNYFGVQPYANYLPNNNYFAMQQLLSQPTYSNAGNGVIFNFTNGLAGAQGFSMPPNSTAFLMDSDAQKFYIKTSDRNGMCTIKPYKFEEIVSEEPTAATPTFNAADYVTKEEFKNVVQELCNQVAAIKSVETTPVVPKTSLL